MTVDQDAAVYATLMDPDQAATHRFRPGFSGCRFADHGAAHVEADGDAVEIDQGGAAKVQSEPAMTVRPLGDAAELLLVETRLQER